MTADLIVSVAMGPAAFAVVWALLGRERVVELRRLMRRDGAGWLARGGFPVLLLLTSSPVWAVSTYIADGLTAVFVARLALHVAETLVILPWARFVLVDISMSQTWWKGSWQIVALIAIQLGQAAVYVAQRDVIRTIASIASAVMWVWWRRSGPGKGWDDDVVPSWDPSPAGAHR